ncbi:MAG: hypothetical protein ACT4QA_13160 [Panacagrimonas sp.]
MTESEPWKTLNKVNTATFEFGSTIYLKRGSRWSESIMVPSSGLTIDAYGSGALPALDSSTLISGWTSASFLGLFGNGLYVSPPVAIAAAGVGGLGNLSENGVMMSLAPWKGSASGSLDAYPVGSYSYDFNARRLYIKPSTHPNNAGRVYRASTLLYGVRADDRSDVTVQNLHLTRFSLHAVSFSDCTGCTARNLTITDGGGAVVIPPSTYAGNGIEWSGNSSYGVADGVSISNLLDSGISPQTFAQGSNVHDIEIRNSTIDRVGMAGVEVSLLGYGGGSSISDISISDLGITNAGRGWSGNRYGKNGHGILIGNDPAAGAISGVTVQRTTVTNSVGNGVDFFGEVGTVTLNRVRLTGNQLGVFARALTGQGQTLKLVMTASIIDLNRGDGLQYLTPSGAGFSLFHNTFYRNGTRNVHISGQNGQALIENNVFAGEATMAQLHVDNLVNNNSQVLYGASVNHNCYSKTSGMVLYKGVSHSTIATFRTATGFEAAGVEAAKGFLSNPTGLQLANPAAGNFALNPGSPCIARGSGSTGVAIDYLGNAYKTPPSMGAVEASP